MSPKTRIRVCGRGTAASIKHQFTEKCFDRRTLYGKAFRDKLQDRKIDHQNRIIMEAMGNALSELNGEGSKADIAFYEERAKAASALL